MQMNRMEHDLWVRAVNELCRRARLRPAPDRRSA